MRDAARTSTFAHPSPGRGQWLPPGRSVLRTHPAPRAAGVWLLVFVLAFSAGCARRPAARRAITALDQVRLQIRVKPAAVLSAGAAKVEITPPVGTPLAGYAKRHGKPSTGIRDPLYVRALALSDGEDTLLLVSADLLLFPPPMAERILGELTRQFKVPRQAILLAGTHTHSGSGAIAPGFLYERVFGSYSKAVEDGIVSRVEWAVRSALDHLKPVEWSDAEEPSFLEGFVENRAIPGGPADPGVALLAFKTPQGELKALLMNAAAHPTLLDSRDLRFSAGFPGELCRRVEADCPGTVCLFVNGAAGDARPCDSIGADAEQRVQRFGGLLAEAATALLNRARWKTRADLAAWGGWVALPEPQIHLGPIPIHPEIGRLMRPTSAFLHLMAIDDLLLVPLQAELNTALGVSLKQRLRAQGLRPLLLGYADGYLGYAVTPQQYGNGSYESEMTWYGAEFGEFLLDDFEMIAGLYSGKGADGK